jgi:hypothetical protein
MGYIHFLDTRAPENGPHRGGTMARIHRLGFTRDEAQEQADRQTTSLAGLAVALLLVVLSLHVLRQLAARTAIEDCLMAGHSNCDMIVNRLR